MIKSAICEMLGIEYPVFQGGMAWIADGKLAAAVSTVAVLALLRQEMLLVIMSDSRFKLPRGSPINLLV